MSKRSHYPAISLAEAVKKLELIYGREGPSSMSSEVAVQHMGYSGLNGASLTVLAGLKKYSLLEGRAENLKVSQNGIIIISDEHVDDQTERVAALQAALVADSLFKELYDRFGDKTTDININSYLKKKGFKPAAARTAAKSYIESTAFVKQETGSYNHEEEIDQQEVETMSAPIGAITMKPSALVQPTDYQEAHIVISGVSQWPIIRLPKQFSSKNWDDMVNTLDVMKAGFISKDTDDATLESTLLTKDGDEITI